MKKIKTLRFNSNALLFNVDIQYNSVVEIYYVRGYSDERSDEA